MSLLIEDSPNPWQMLGGAREMQVKRRESEPGGIPSLVLGEKWLTPGHGMRCPMAGGAGVAEDSTEGSRDAGLARGPAQPSIFRFLLLHTMGAKGQRQGGGRSYLPVVMG